MRCGLLGKTLGHSYSPQIHAQLGDYSYELFEKQPEELENFLRHGEFDALNVTIPYKKAVLPYCAVLSDAVKAIGSANTLVGSRTARSLPTTPTRSAFRASRTNAAWILRAKKRWYSAAAARASRRSMC